MLRVTKLADYGVVLLTQFACDPQHRMHNARDIAGEVHLPQPVVSKILKLLTHSGLLISHRGTKGGYSLARSPEEITVAQIIRVLEGPIAITECTDRVHGECGLEHRCQVRGNWHRINQAIREALNKITLAELARPVPQCVVNMFDHTPMQGMHLS